MRDGAVLGLKVVGVTLAACGFLSIMAVHTANKINSIPKERTEADAAVRLDATSGQGVCSATHIGGGQLVTAWHCLGMGEMSASTEKGSTAKVEMLWSAKPYDLALLHADGLKAGSASIDCALAKVDSTVTAAGNPLGLPFIRTKGTIISALQEGELNVGGDALWKERFLADVTIAPGNSGGGLFDMLGRMVGVVVGMFPGFRYAIVVPSTTVCKLLGR